MTKKELKILKDNLNKNSDWKKFENDCYIYQPITKTSIGIPITVFPNIPVMPDKIQVIFYKDSIKFIKNCEREEVIISDKSDNYSEFVESIIKLF